VAYHEADLGRVRAAGRGGGDAGAVDDLREQVGEDGRAGLVAGGVDVGDVVADHVHHHLVAAEAGDSREHRTEHVDQASWV